MSSRSGVLYDAISLDVQNHFIENLDFMNPWYTHQQFAGTYLLNNVIRKWIPLNTDIPDRAAFDAFISANNRCKDWLYQPQWEIDRVVLGEIQRDIEDLLSENGLPFLDSFYDLLREGRPGPGAARGALGTSYYSKFFSSRLTTTSRELYNLYSAYSEWIPSFCEAECQRFQEFGFPEIVSGSKCTFVPKTDSCSRMVCVEPSLNMFFQLGLATLLEQRLRRSFGIDLKTQPDVNRELARRGSIDGTLCTIDLSSASDSVSLRLVELLFPRWFFHTLLELRSPFVEISGVDTRLYMISTMGNGFTFPLQTIIFSAILRAVNRVFLSNSVKHEWSCFGDDLICRTEVFHRVKYYLEQFGFILNPKKTFNQGLFRESCGSDWYNGQAVRPVFVKQLRTSQDITIAINLLLRWSANTSIRLHESIRYLYSLLSPKFRYFVPYSENLDAGIHVPSRYLDALTYDENRTAVYRRFLSRPSVLRVKENSISGTRRYKKLIYNPHGLFMSFLYGELVNMHIAVRHNRTMYTTNVAKIPYWDFWPVGVGGTGPSYTWQQWETTVLTHLP
jgi:hypothetical protein